MKSHPATPLTTEQTTEQLTQLLNDFEAFMLAYGDKLQAAVAELESTRSPESSTLAPHSTTDFDEERRRWEAQRALEQEQMREQTRLLEEAWLSLEKEQREFLQVKDSHAATHHATAVSGRLKTGHCQSSATDDGRRSRRETPAARTQIPSRSRKAPSMSSCD